ncbi:MAG: alpha/beta hydrolase [Candidatus Wallbacteria bacterium]
MQSLKSRFFNFMIRNRHLFEFKLKRESFDFDSSIEEFREKCEKGAAKYSKIPDGVKIIKESAAGINSEWIIPDGADNDKTIFYVHGGGYVSGSCSDHRGFISKFADFCKIPTFIYEYRLAPENPFPAAIDDSVKAYEWLLSGGKKPENILVAGESAGGGLALALLLALRERKIAFPKAVVAISPWTDLSCSGESYKTKNKISGSLYNSWNVFSKYYAGDTDVKNPLVSPLYGDLHGLPPIFINSGEADELFDDGKSFYLKAKAAGVDVYFREGAGMLHCYPLLSPFFPEATEAMNEIRDFIRNHMGLSSLKKFGD